MPLRWVHEKNGLMDAGAAGVFSRLSPAAGGAEEMWEPLASLHSGSAEETLIRLATGLQVFPHSREVGDR